MEPESLRNGVEMGGAEKYRKGTGRVQRGTERYREVQKGYKEVQRDTPGRRPQRDTRKRKKMSRGFRQSTAAQIKCARQRQIWHVTWRKYVSV